MQHTLDQVTAEPGHRVLKQNQGESARSKVVDPEPRLRALSVICHERKTHLDAASACDARDHSELGHEGLDGIDGADVGFGWNRLRLAGNDKDTQIVSRGVATV